MLYFWAVIHCYSYCYGYTIAHPRCLLLQQWYCECLRQCRCYCLIVFVNDILLVAVAVAVAVFAVCAAVAAVVANAIGTVLPLLL